MADQMDVESDKNQSSLQQIAEGTAPAASSSHAPAADIVSPASASSANSKKAAWNTAKHREDADVFQSRLTDQSFNPANFGDPLTSERPMITIYERQFSDAEKQFFAELEAGVDEKISKRRAQ